MMAPREFVLCPVDGCEWQLERTEPAQPPLLPLPGSLVTQALLAEAARLEQTLRVHLESHDVVDFVRTINRLTQQVDRMERQP